MPVRVAFSVAMEMHFPEALVVRTKVEHIVERLIKKCAALRWRLLVDHLFISFTSLLLCSQLLVLTRTWAALSRVESLHEPPTTLDILMKHLKWLLPLLFLLSLYEQLLMRFIRSYAQFAKKLSLILPYNILLIVAWVLLINYDYKLIVPKGCLFDEAENSTTLDVIMFNNSQTLTSCIVELIPAAIGCSRCPPYKLSMDFAVKATTFWDVVNQWSLCLFGAGGAFTLIYWIRSIIFLFRIENFGVKRD